ncbi:tRNA threonylcarbamoyladenosine biosynthesis protein TsaB [Clostridium tepidiprofundi DSM 19306]|uniref:tRNA threonylcarbamoyladenosine biosynthesis protein TsaB n=1 Tax=Clostridium tepidiprofundi DSM 19306 TaxID=1121338 RepID=A0A151AXQ1_9CLOT|nr:tRNA (adenosine(37)-N6)-threonylcarbamoyltransferase complex dimerization subunit type 1 TsaB [Clostridium tepidiprofundi]KYH32425.1 tRNA threonylcarbamoyladenosine biosynthesis protein TsaB [Clostridium tepidiprofundi DSM 19306]
MKILSLDSATESATCSILDENKLLGEIIFNYKKQHSIVLMPIIDELLKNTNTSLEDIDGFVVSKGPGSFTGLRIGMAVIKGLAQGTNKPFVSISTLDALAYNLAFTDGIICPIMDALRDNVYTALYEFNGNELNRLTDYMAISVDDLILLLKDEKKSVTFVGDAVTKFKDKLNSEIKSVKFSPTHLNIAKASSLAELGLIKLKKGFADDLYSSAPVYIRKSQAEREYDKRMNLYD